MRLVMIQLNTKIFKFFFVDGIKIDKHGIEK